MKQDFKTALVLLKAADLIEEKGWCTGDFRKTSEKGERFCALGALRQVTGYYDTDDRTWNMPLCFAAQDELEIQIMDDYGLHESAGGMAVWNDSQRDRRKVIRLFRRAAKRLLSHV